MNDTEKPETGTARRWWIVGGGLGCAILAIGVFIGGAGIGIAWWATNHSSKPNNTAKKIYTRTELSKEFMGATTEKLREVLGAPDAIEPGDFYDAVWTYNDVICEPDGSKSKLQTQFFIKRGIVSDIFTH
jgi:hypothetical protein